MKKNIVFYSIYFLCGLVLWFFAFKIFSTTNVLSPIKVFKTFFSFFSNPSFYVDIIFSTLRILIIFLLSFISSLGLAIILSLNQFFYKMFQPIIWGVFYIPFFVWIILYFNFFDNSQIGLFIISIFFISSLIGPYITRQIKTIPEKYIVQSRLFGLSEFDYFAKIVFPYLSKYLIQYSKINLYLVFLFVITIEYLYYSIGIGFLLKESLELGKSEYVLSLLFVIFIFSVVLNSLVNLFTKEKV